MQGGCEELEEQDMKEEVNGEVGENEVEEEQNEGRSCPGSLSAPGSRSKHV